MVSSTPPLGVNDHPGIPDRRWAWVNASGSSLMGGIVGPADTAVISDVGAPCRTPAVPPPGRPTRRPSPVGQPDKVELTLKIVLPRAVAERLTTRAIREERKLDALIQEILEGTTKELTSPCPARGSP
jgi:hypothetical protein